MLLQKLPDTFPYQAIAFLRKKLKADGTYRQP
jgi:hypothetical protein